MKTGTPTPPLSDAQQTRRGRPRDLTKKDEILDAARRLFLLRGPDAVTIDALVGESRISRATFYSHFSDSTAVLEAVIRRESERIVSDTFDEETEGDTLEQKLVKIGIHVMELFSDPDMIGFDRLISAVAAKQPDLAHRFYDVGPGRARDILVDLIRSHVKNGQLRIDDPVEASGDLAGLWQGFIRLELSCRRRRRLDAGEIRARAERGVGLFMRLYGASEPIS